jgi:hypothetical protein
VGQFEVAGVGAEGGGRLPATFNLIILFPYSKATSSKS